jgi:hypothetical protein
MVKNSCDFVVIGVTPKPLSVTRQYIWFSVDCDFSRMDIKVSSFLAGNIIPVCFCFQGVKNKVLEKARNRGINPVLAK